MPSRTVKDIDLHFDWQPKQYQFLKLWNESPFTRIGYGGSKGGGKSHGGRQIALARRLQYPNTSALIFRRTFKELNKNHIRPLFTQFPRLRRYYNTAEHTLWLPWANSSLTFGFAEHESDILAFTGSEFTDILIDEAQLCTEFMLMKLVECCRCTTNDDITPKVGFLMNPGGLGHSYNKRVFIDKEYVENEDPKAYTFLQAYGWDNVNWALKSLREDGLTERDFYSWSAARRREYFVTRTDYGRTLNALPEHERKAQLEGDWDVFEGAFFSMWRNDIHKIAPLTPHPRWPVLGVIDYGAQTALEVGTRDHEKNVITFAECYTDRLSPSLRFNDMADMLIAKRLWNLKILCDTNMFISLEHTYGYKDTPAEIARKVFEERMGSRAPTLEKVDKGKMDERNYRQLCNETYKEYLTWERNDRGELTRRPRHFVTSDCPVLIKTLPTLMYGKDKDGLDFDPKIGIDHPYDADKMLLMALAEVADKKGRKLSVRTPYGGTAPKKRQWKVGQG